jgi:hypothetical protein
MTAAGCLILMLAAGLAGGALGGCICVALDFSLLDAPGWACLAAGQVFAACVGTAVLYRLCIVPQMEAARAAAAEKVLAETKGELQRRLRHDIRGALSPALLTADRLLANRDPAVQRAGDIIVRAVEKVAALLADPPAPESAAAESELTPPGRP